MSIVKSEDFKIIKGKEIISLTNFILKLLNTFFALFAVFILHNPRINPILTGFNLDV